jgi:hypothetical protein
MGTGELSHARERERQHRADRPGEIRQPARGVCQTDLVETFRELYPELTYGGNRSILLDAADALPDAALRHCVAPALTYHLNKRKNNAERLRASRKPYQL